MINLEKEMKAEILIKTEESKLEKLRLIIIVIIEEINERVQ